MDSNAPLRLTGSLHVAPSADELYDDLADALCADAIQAVGARKVFHLALSGGSTPEPFYIRLVTDPRFRMMPWAHTHVWLVDERRVPPEDDRSNFKMIRETLLDHVPVRKRHVHPVHTSAPDAAELYEAALRENIPDGRLDFALLGMGGDGHTASLFPGSAALDVRGRWVTANDGPGVTPPARVTMTFPFLNEARHIAVLVTGEKKAATIRLVDHQIHSAGPDPRKFPITGIAPTVGHTAWYLDADAAGWAKDIGLAP